MRPLARKISLLGAISLGLGAMIGAGQTGRAEIVVTGFKIAALLVVVAFGLGAIAAKAEPTAPFTPFMPEGVLGLGVAMGQVAVAIYVMIAVVMRGAVTAPPGEEVHRYLGKLGELGFMEAAGQFVPAGKAVLLIAGLASTASALNATVYGSSRIAFAMGRGDALPTPLGRVHPTRKTPHIASAATGCVMILVTLVLPIRDIAAAADIMFFLVFAMVCATLIRLRSRWPDRERPFRAALAPWLPGLGLAAGVLLSVGLIHLSPAAWPAAGIWLIFGVGVGAKGGWGRGL